MSKYGPNVTKLILQFVTRNAIPPGGGIADGIEFFRNPERRKQVLEKSEADALAAIQLIQSAPDNPFGDDPEKIAEEILRKIEERKEIS